jgi:hypothetical protein
MSGRHQEALNWLHAQYLAPARAESPAAPKAAQPVNVDDTELLNIARTADNGKKFADLYDRADSNVYGGDESAADQGLVNMLVFWTHGDAARIERLFNASALGQRDKWRNRPDYRKRTIDSGLAYITERYDPSEFVRVELNFGKAVEAMGREPSTDQIVQNVDAEYWKTLYLGTIATLSRPGLPMRVRAHMVLNAEEARRRGCQEGDRIEVRPREWAARWNEPEASIRSTFKKITNPASPIRFVTERKKYIQKDGSVLYRPQIHGTLTVPNTDILATYAMMPITAELPQRGGKRPPHCELHGEAYILKQTKWICTHPECGAIVAETPSEPVDSPDVQNERVCAGARTLETPHPDVGIPLVDVQNERLDDEEPPDRDDYTTSSPTADGKCHQCKLPLTIPECTEGSGLCSACIQELYPAPPPPWIDDPLESYGDYIAGGAA